MKEDLKQELEQVKANHLLSLKTIEEEFSVPKDYFKNKKAQLQQIAGKTAVSEDYFASKKTSLKQIATAGVKEETKVVELSKYKTKEQPKNNQKWLMIAAAIMLLAASVPVINSFINQQQATTEVASLFSEDEFSTTEIAYLEGNLEEVIYESFYNEETDTSNEETDYSTELDNLFSIEQL